MEALIFNIDSHTAVTPTKRGGERMEKGTWVYWDCKTCGYRMSDIQYQLVQYDTCPRCKAHLSTFKRIVDRVKG